MKQDAYRTLNGNYPKTFPSNQPMFLMDRIYYRGINLVDSFCLQRQPWDELSDHLPLYARFAFG